MLRVLRHGALGVVIVAVVALAMPARANQAMQRLSQFCGAANLAHAHRSVPVALAARAPAGPYAVSLWADPDVGTGVLYVVVTPQDGVPFVAPRTVSLRLRAASGAAPEGRYNAYPEAVRYGARFVAPVALPRVDTWQVRVLIDGAPGAGELQASFASVAPGTLGAGGMLLYAAPFVLVAGLWGRGHVARRQQYASRPASIQSP